MHAPRTSRRHIFQLVGAILLFSTALVRVSGGQTTGPTTAPSTGAGATQKRTPEELAVFDQLVLDDDPARDPAGGLRGTKECSRLIQSRGAMRVKPHWAA